MGQKVNPIGLRVGIIRGWSSQWYAEKDYAASLHEDLALRATLKKKLYHAGVSKIIIHRLASKINVDIYSARPGIIIGKKGAGIDTLKEELKRTMKKEIFINIFEVKKPEIDAQLVAENIANQLSRRMSFRRAIKSTSAATMRAGAKGVRIEVAGRLNGAEMSRREKEIQGSVPLHTLRADIDFAQVHAHTVAGIVGVKVWIYKGEN